MAWAQAQAQAQAMAWVRAPVQGLAWAQEQEPPSVRVREWVPAPVLEQAQEWAQASVPPKQERPLCRSRFQLADSVQWKTPATRRYHPLVFYHRQYR